MDGKEAVWFIDTPNSRTCQGTWPDSSDPTVGTPGFLVRIDDDSWGYSQDRLQIRTLSVDWDNPPASVFDRQASLATADFDSSLCGDFRNRIEQPGTGISDVSNGRHFP